MLQIMNQILTQGGFLRAFFQTVILIAAGCGLFCAVGQLTLFSMPVL